MKFSEIFIVSVTINLTEVCKNYSLQCLGDQQSALVGQMYHSCLSIRSARFASVCS